MNRPVSINKYNPSVPTVRSHFIQSTRTASYLLFTLLLFLLNLSSVQSDAEVKCPLEMGWDGVNDTNICKTWLAVNYYTTDEIDILDKAIATCDDLPNGKMLHPRPVDMEEKENETNKVEGVAILPWRLIEKAVKQEESTLTTIITMNMTSGDVNETAMTPEALPSAYKNVNSKNLPMCSFLNKDNTESIDSCKTHDGAVRVLCKSSKLEHCNPDGRKCRCDAGWEGPFCKERENKCKKNSCSSNGICFMNDEGEASCACLPGSTGTECKEDSENDCEQVTCSYHGKCENKLRDFKCKCDPGFTGNFCEIAIRSSAAVVSITAALPLVALILQAIVSWHPVLLTSY